MKKTLSIFILLFALFSFSCKTSQNSGTSKEVAQAEKLAKKKKKKVRADTLIGELRKLPGVRVSGNDSNGTVMIGRGANTIKTNQSVLFVVNDVRMGNSLPQVAAAINVQQIDKIKVLRGNEASSKYGLQGTNGVIEIKMMQ